MTCKDFQNDLALAAIEGLKGDRLASLQEHIQICADCACRLQSFESICSAHAAAASELHTLPIQFESARSSRPRGFLSCSQIFRWMLPAAGAGFALVLFLVMQRPGPQVSIPTAPAATAVATSDGPLAGSLARYRKALNGTGKDSFESILARDADVFLRPPSRAELEQLSRL